MANPEHLKILKQGVEVWNKWRKENPYIKPYLREGNFSGANLTNVDLSKADLFRADLGSATLRGADLRKTYFLEAYLLAADLRGANLDGAILDDANLSGASLSGAVLSGAHLHGVNLMDADLISANLRNAYLFDSDLFTANFEGADLEDADLSYCKLVQCDLTSANLTGVKLYGTSREGWIIKDVKCKYVYWDEVGEQRSPKDRDLEPGEFERLYAALPTIEYIFENGMSPIDPLIMDRVVQAIRERWPEFDIKIDSINARSLAPSIKFTVRHEEHKEPALEEVRKGYDERISRLESEKERLYQLLGQAIDKAGEVRLITGGIVAMDNATINIEQNIHNAIELQKAIADEPEESKSFAKVAKKTALDIISEAIKDIAKGQVKEATKQIIELGKDLGPIIAKTAAYAFFKSMIG